MSVLKNPGYGKNNQKRYAVKRADSGKCVHIYTYIYTHIQRTYLFLYLV